ncbi:MAG: 3-isopropylmalate dehydratase large subunit, partial [Nitrospinota bacterium]
MMGLTLAEKIIGQAAGCNARAGEIALVEVDLAYLQDGTGPLAVRQLQGIEMEFCKTPPRAVVFLDHAAPSPRAELSNE